MLWTCDDCLTETVSDPLAHTDYGGEIVVYGPHCPECGCPMRLDDPDDLLDLDEARRMREE